MKRLALLALLPALAFAAPEGALVTAGPLTALDKLQSVPMVKDAPIPHRNIQVKSWQTMKGTKVMFVENHDLPMLDVRLVFDAGSARDGEKSGLASLDARSARSEAGVAPSSPRAAVTSGLTSYTTQVCPSRIRLRAIFAPLRPRCRCPR